MAFPAHYMQVLCDERPGRFYWLAPAPRSAWLIQRELDTAISRMSDIVSSDVGQATTYCTKVAWKGSVCFTLWRRPPLLLQRYVCALLIWIVGHRYSNVEGISHDKPNSKTRMNDRRVYRAVGPMNENNHKKTCSVHHPRPAHNGTDTSKRQKSYFVRVLCSASCCPSTPPRRSSAISNRTHRWQGSDEMPG